MLRRIIGACDDTDHVKAGRAHLFVSLIGLNAIISALAFVAAETVITLWHHESRKHHAREARRLGQN